MATIKLSLKNVERVLDVSRRTCSFAFRDPKLRKACQAGVLDVRKAFQGIFREAQKKRE